MPPPPWFILRLVPTWEPQGPHHTALLHPSKQLPSHPISPRLLSPNCTPSLERWHGLWAGAPNQTKTQSCSCPNKAPASPKAKEQRKYHPLKGQLQTFFPGLILILIDVQSLEASLYRHVFAEEASQATVAVQPPKVCIFLGFSSVITFSNYPDYQTLQPNHYPRTFSSNKHLL